MSQNALPCYILCRTPTLRAHAAADVVAPASLEEVAEGVLEILRASMEGAP